MKKHISLFALGVALVFAQPAAAQHSLNVRDADVRAFIEDAAQVTGRTFIIDGRVQGKVSVVTDRPLSRSEYFEVFLSTLRANGLIAVPTANGAYRIQPTDGADAAARRTSSSPRYSAFARSMRPRRSKRCVRWSAARDRLPRIVAATAWSWPIMPTISAASAR